MLNIICDLNEYGEGFMVIYCSVWLSHTKALKEWLKKKHKTKPKPEAWSPHSLLMVANFGGDDSINSAGALSLVAMRQFLEYCYCLWSAPFYGNKLTGLRLWSSNWRMRSSGAGANGRKPCSKNQLVQEIKTKDLKINKTDRLGGMTLKFSWLIVWGWTYNYMRSS